MITCGLSTCKSPKEFKQTIYENNFDTGDITHLSNTKISTFNQSKVLGNFNNDGFELILNQIPTHDLIEISFDLYIHDTWDGNKTSNGIDGPDIWEMQIDGSPYIYTTFSNTICATTFCSPQSYPDDYPNNNHNPRSGAVDVLLPGFCSLKLISGGSTLYKIRKIIQHKNSSLNLKCLDHLIQTNVKPAICDESWSIDNLKIVSISLN
ncbi:MAG: hypothetical protein KJ744_04580 [Bacteroidetes bacterium]|nr:hypothetical protein [Bacteroidota bacterium]